MNYKYKNESEHLCFNCVNGYPSRCPKIADETKRKAEEYEFITEATQDFDSDNNITSFVVKQCNNFELAPAKKDLPSGKLKYLKSLKKQIIAGYFETETAEEAYLFQQELFERGHLRINGNYLPDEKTINVIKKRIKK